MTRDEFTPPSHLNSGQLHFPQTEHGNEDVQKPPFRFAGN